jgi:hypothetical protein
MHSTCRPHGASATSTARPGRSDEIVARSSANDAARSHELNRRLSVGLFVLLVGLAGWIAYLALHLPGRFSAKHWDVAWVGVRRGIDRRSRLHRVGRVVPSPDPGGNRARRRDAPRLRRVVRGLDVIPHSRSDVDTRPALFVELPLAGIFAWLAHRIMLGTVTAFRTMSADPQTPPLRLRDAPLLFAETRTDPTTDPFEPAPRDENPRER